MTTEKRQYVRAALPGTTVTMSCGNRIINSCDVCDVSAGGLFASDLPRKCFDTTQNVKQMICTAVVTYKGKVVKIKVAPRWLKGLKDSPYTGIGFEVIENNKAWFEFIRMQTSLMLKRQADVWGLNGTKYVNR